MATTPKNISTPIGVIKPLAIKYCTHEIELQNLNAASSADSVRVSAIAPEAKIVSSSAPPNWHQSTNYPTSVVWRPPTLSALPTGKFPAGFSVDIKNDKNKNKRILVEWMEKDQVICRQVLQVGCGQFAEYVTDEIKMPAGIAKVIKSEKNPCRCFSAQSNFDDASNELAEPDISVELGTPISIGFLKVSVPYTLEFEPAFLAVERHWEVTVLDELESEQPIVVPVVDNLVGQAIFTLPYGGEYCFYLTVTDPALCTTAGYKIEEADELSDTDFATFGTTATGSVFETKQPNICDPRTYTFTDVTEPLGVNPTWTVKQGTLVIAQGSGSPFQLTLPAINQNYTVYFDAYEPSGAQRPQVSKNISTAVKAPELDFEIFYDSCASNNFIVNFSNLSTSPSCPVAWTWDFGDSVGTSIDQNPTYTYVAAGSYIVTLTLTIGTGSNVSTSTFTKQIVVENWQPHLKYEICEDGHVVYWTDSNFKSGLFHDKLTWSFPFANPPIFYKHRKKLRVCYDEPGIKTASLEGTNENGGTCTTYVEFVILNIFRACPRDKVKHDKYFSYLGKNYRLRTKFKYRGNVLGRIFAKSKLQIQRPSGRWRRKRAHEISITIAGQIIRKTGDCFNSNFHQISGSKNRSNRAKISKWILPGVGNFRVRQNELHSGHLVRVDANHAGESHSNSLWIHECSCGIWS